MVEQQGRNNQGVLQSLKTLEENFRTTTSPPTKEKVDQTKAKETKTKVDQIKAKETKDKMQGIILGNTTLQGSMHSTPGGRIKGVQDKISNYASMEMDLTGEGIPESVEGPTPDFKEVNGKRRKTGEARKKAAQEFCRGDVLLAAEEITEILGDTNVQGYARYEGNGIK